jgi:NADH-quinone oxidoreductase subunit F
VSFATDKPLTQHIRPGGEPLDLAAKLRAGGYQGLARALALAPHEITEEVRKSNLRGRGGAGFPTGIKWSAVPMGKDAPRPKYLVANADEMEPGTFKDRFLMEGDPHQLIEGMLIAARAIEAETGYIFVRGEYTLAIRRLRRAIAEAEGQGYLDSVRGSGHKLALHVHVSAGRYMCGDETGLLNALEGRRANPRAKPPFPQTSGLWGKPTVVQNVETLCNLPHIMAHGAEWFRNLSRTGDGGTKLYGASGRVQRPGLWELPMGTTAREILDEHAGGMREGYSLRAVIPGGASTGFLLDRHLDVRMDFNEVQKHGSRLGTGCIIVLDDRTCPVGMVHALEEFFARESCGWCTPCWSGLPWVERILHALEEGRGEPGDLEALEHQTRQCALGRTFCALAPGAMEPLQSALVHFRDVFERHVHERRCPWRT